MRLIAPGDEKAQAVVIAGEDVHLRKDGGAFIEPLPQVKGILFQAACDSRPAQGEGQDVREFVDSGGVTR